VLRDLYRLQRNGILKFTLQTPAIAVQIKPCNWFQPIRASVSQQDDDATARGGGGGGGVLTIEKLSMLVYYLLYGAERCNQSKVNPFRYCDPYFKYLIYASTLTCTCHIPLSFTWHLNQHLLYLLFDFN
jgi:hypothetical protein